MNIKQRHFIKSTEIKVLKEEIKEQYDQEFVNKIFPKKCHIELILTETDDILYAVNKDLVLWKSKEHGFIPVLTQLLENKISLKTVIVDMGAIKFITINRADIMRPGITKIDPDIRKNDIIRLCDETHNQTLAVGKAIYDAEQMERMEKGKVIYNLHTIKDDIWKFAKEF